MYFILTVDRLNNANNGFRLRMFQRDHEILIPGLQGMAIYIDLPDTAVSEVQAGTFFPYGNLVNPTISNWIIENQYTHEVGQNPARLIFEFTNTTFKYYEPQAH